MFNIPALIFPAFFLKPKLLGRYNAIRNLSEATLLNFSCESRQMSFIIVHEMPLIGQGMNQRDPNFKSSRSFIWR